ncbi:MAG: arginine deiminase family protein [Clostridium sp.]|uniref:dimethylarginine dimethylaminohydrolase family protein n=1 Tax=Clostridium sp. TaxID=1506 RepID=UPI002FCC4354
MKDLKYILMRYPSYFEIIDYRNEHKDTITMEKVYDNYNNLLNILSEENIQYYFLNTGKGPSEVFTRDIGFTLDDTLFVCKLKSRHRKKETEKLLEHIKKNRYKYYEFENEIEGGDIVIGESTIFVGLSQRTSEEAIKELETYLEETKSKYKVQPIRFDTESKLHLDCVFNILDKKSAIVCDYIYDMEIIENNFKNLYYLSKKSADNFGTNVIPLGKKRVICSDIEAIRVLRKGGYKVLQCEFDEITKAGGSICCSTLPIRL